MRSRLFYNFGLVMRKPSVFMRIFNNYILLFAGIKRLRSVEIDLGFGCQLNCEHCYASELIDPKRKTLNTTDIKNVIDQCVKEGAIHFLISGGEPLIYDNVYEVIEYINKKNAFSCLVTNGVNLSDDTIKKLAKSRLDLIEISLDSSREEVHDKNRNMKGLYKNVLRAISLCKKNNITVFTSSVITNENLIDGDLQKIINLGKSNNIRTHLCFPVATGKWKDKEILLTAENRIKAKKMFKKENIRCCEEGNYLKAGCSAGIEKICINPYGDVMPCPYIQASFGNIIDEKFSDILKRMRNNKYFSSLNGPCQPAFNKIFIKEMMTEINKAKPKPLKLK